MVDSNICRLYELDPKEIDEWIRIKQERTMQRISV